jgi:serine/threonine protein kinase
LTGEALGQLVRDDRASTKFAPPAPPGTWEAFGPAPFPAVVAGLGAQLASALAHAHDRGVRHGKLKPSNVLLADDGVPMLLDFDLAEHSRAGGPADAKEDIYALAVLLHELLTGKLPPRDGPGELPAGGARNLSIPRALDRVLRGCLAGQYRSAHAVAEALDGYARRPSWADRIRAWAAQRV